MYFYKKIYETENFIKKIQLTQHHHLLQSEDLINEFFQLFSVYFDDGLESLQVSYGNSEKIDENLVMFFGNL